MSASPCSENDFGLITGVEKIYVFATSGIKQIRLSFLFPAWETLGSVREISNRVGSDECLVLASKWMHDCVKFHEDWASCTRLPKRVIYFNSDNGELRPVEPEGVDAPYVALTHRWGTNQPLITPRSTLDLRKQRLELARWTDERGLSKNNDMQDACSVNLLRN